MNCNRASPDRNENLAHDGTTALWRDRQSIALACRRTSRCSISDRLADAGHPSRHESGRWHDLAYFDRDSDPHADRRAFRLASHTSGRAGKFVATLSACYVRSRALAALFASTGDNAIWLVFCVGTRLDDFVVLFGAAADANGAKLTAWPSHWSLARKFRMGFADPRRRARRHGFPALVLLSRPRHAAHAPSDMIHSGEALGGGCNLLMLHCTDVLQQCDAMGHERHFGRPDPMSALPPLSTAIATCRAVVKGQEETRALQHEPSEQTVSRRSLEI
jgi:hypothetical protein